MTYQSPLHIIDGIAEKDFAINETNLIRLRKKLLADLNLSGKTTIEVSGKSFSKDEIIKIIDQLLANTDLELHEFIYQNKSLLNYLEKEDTSFSADHCIRLQAPEELQNKLSLLLEARFLLQLKKGISKRNFTQAKEAVLYIKQLKESRKPFCYDEIYKHLTSLTSFNNEIIRQIQEGQNLPKEIIAGNHFRYLGDASVAAFLNALPEEFNDSIDTFQVSVINLMFYYHKKKGYNKKLVESMSYMLIGIRHCTPEHSKLIKENHKAYTESSSSSYFSGYGGMIVFGIIVLVRVLGAASTCNNHKPSPQYPIRRYIKEASISPNHLFNNERIKQEAILIKF